MKGGQQVFGLSPNFIFQLPGLLIAMTIHEFAHAYVAHRLGDPTPRLQGRLTLNPVAHIDPMGLLMLVFFRFGWGRSVEVNPSYFRNYRKGMVWVSLAGPASNLLLGLVVALTYGLMAKLAPFLLLSQVFRQITVGIMLYNVYLAVFNLIPIPPLDGSKILVGILPAQSAYRYHESVHRYGPILLLVLVYSGATRYIVSPLANSVLGLYSGVIGLFF